MSINRFFNTVSVSRFSRPITVTRDPLYHVLPVFFLIMLLNYIPDSNHTVKYSNLHEDVKTEQKGGKFKQRNMILICISERTLFIKENKKEMRPA